MYYALTVSGNIITGVHESLDMIAQGHFAAHPELASHQIIPLDAPAEYSAGMDIRCFNEDGTLKPVVWLIENGYMEIPSGYEMIDGELVESNVPESEAPVTLVERVLEAAQIASTLTERLAQAEQLNNTLDEVMTDLVSLLISQGVIISV